MEERKGAISSLELCSHLRQQIRMGTLVPGQRLVEAEITGETGAPRAKVREALRRLETEGLVVIEEFRGASVRRVSLEEVRHIYKARMVLEGLAAREFAASDAAERKQQLLQIQEQLDECVESGDHESFALLNSEWHRAIVSGSGNPYLATFLERLVVPVYRLVAESFYNTAAIRVANADHRQITEAIVSGDGDEAERAMKAHVEQGLAAVSKLDASLSA